MERFISKEQGGKVIIECLIFFLPNYSVSAIVILSIIEFASQTRMGTDQLDILVIIMIKEPFWLMEVSVG